MEENWKWYEIRPRLAQLIQEKRVYRWHQSLAGRATAEGLVIIHDSDPESMILNYLDTPTGHWTELAGDVYSLAVDGRGQLLKSKPLAAPEIRAAFPAAGWTVDHDLEMWVFERPIE
jgi:hypothetical protein